MIIAILGAGNVGGALGQAWAARGHTIRFGVRNPDAADTLNLVRTLGARASAHANAEAVRGADAVVLATPWGQGGSSARSALEACGNLTGKLVIDCTNPLEADLSGLAVGHTTSGGELVASWARGASVCKAFNQTGANNMASRAGYAHPLVMYVAGDDAAKKALALELARDAGFEAIDAGPLSIARLLEPLAMLWTHLAYRQGLGREYETALLRRNA